MKFYGDVKEFETILKDAQRKDNLIIDRVFSDCVLPSLDVEYSDDNNLCLYYGALGLGTDLDSSTAFAISDYYRSMGYALREIEKKTDQTPFHQYDPDEHIIGYCNNNEYKKFRAFVDNVISDMNK